MGTMERRHQRWRVVIGWITVLGSILITSFWAFWGSMESLHEGWYHHHLGKNLIMMFGQHLFAMLLFMVVALIALKWRWMGVAVHLAGAVWVIWFFWGIHPETLATFYVPLTLLAFGYGIGTPEPRKWAYCLIVGIPWMVAIVCGIEPAIRVAGRIDDMDRNARRVTGNGVDLIWAPEGPGWPLRKHGGGSWDEAVRISRHLSEDGTTVMEEPQNVWRLPTVEEFVRSQHRNGENCNGQWDPQTRRATYERRPDKESPLWATDSNIIYWWVGREVDEKRAWKASYSGNVRPASKSSHFGYWGFRAVKKPAGRAE